MVYILHHADCMEWLDAQPENSFEAIITDPFYGLVPHLVQTLRGGDRPKNAETAHPCYHKGRYI